jgi:hypothetical protein
MTNGRIVTLESIEEVEGCSFDGIELEITWDVVPAEPMVWRTPNGDGYPGSPAMAEPSDVKVLSIWRDDWQVIRRHPHYTSTIVNGLRILSNPDRLNRLESKAWQFVDDNLDEFAEHALEEADNRDEANREAYYEAKREERYLV